MMYDTWLKIRYHKKLTKGPFLTTYGEPHKPVIMMHSFLLRNGNLLYIIFPMYVREWGSDPKLFPKCVHQTLSFVEEQNKKWLRSSSIAHDALSKVAVQDTLLWDMPVFIIPAH